MKRSILGGKLIKKHIYMVETDILLNCKIKMTELAICSLYRNHNYRHTGLTSFGFLYMLKWCAWGSSKIHFQN